MFIENNDDNIFIYYFIHIFKNKNKKLINYLNKIKIFEIYLFTRKKKEINEYIIPKSIKRIETRNDFLIKDITKENIDILIYNLIDKREVEMLNDLKKLKIIFYIHQCFLLWIYTGLFEIIQIYKYLKLAKYVVSLIPFENDYLFKKWGIRSILMNNFIPYEYNSIIPSDLSSKMIVMVGRADDRMKRFKLGISTMKYIITKIPDSRMVIISIVKKEIKNYIQKLKLEKYINFVGYSSKPEIYYRNASLHIFPSICESFGLVVAETKIYGIPNIIIGIDYVSIAKGGTIIIYDDNPEIIAEEAIKLLKNDEYRKKLGKEARESMKKFNNNLLFKKWIKLILSVYNGEKYYQKLREQDDTISKKDALNILNNQLNLLKRRLPNFNYLSTENFENLSIIENIKNK